MVDIYLGSGEKKFVVNKDAQATLDYTWDWTDYLTAIGDVIQTATVTSNGGVSVATQSVVSGTKVVAFIAGGTVGKQHSATCTINTVGGRVDERTIFFNIIDK